MVPPELLRAIADFFEPDNKSLLLDFCIVSRAFHAIAEPLLYQVVRLSDTEAPTSQREDKRIQQFYSRIAQNSELSSYVHTFILSIEAPTPTNELVLEILKRLDQLQVFVLRWPRRQTPFRSWASHIAPCQLSTFAWTGCPLPEEERDFLAFLQSQHQIQCLEINVSYAIPTLPPFTLPYLRKIFVHDWESAFRLLARRSITHFGVWRLRPMLSVPSESVSELLRLSGVQYLTVYQETQPGTAVSFARWLPDLVCLSFYPLQMPSCGYVRSEVSVLEHHQRLVYLRLHHSQSWGGFLSVQIVQSFFEAIPSLRIIDYIRSETIDRYGKDCRSAPLELPLDALDVWPSEEEFQRILSRNGTQ